MSLEKILQRANIRPDIPLLPNPSFKWTDKKRPIPDQTKRFLKILNRPLKPDLIDFISIVIVGTMGFGKTVLVDWICTKIKEFYGTDQVNAIRNRGAKLDALMDHMDSKPIQVLFLDDSFGKMDKDIAKEFTLIRHKFGDILEAAGKPKSGIIISLFGIQDMFTLDKLARRVGTCVIAKSSSSDKYYRTELKKYFGKNGVEELDRITDQVMTHYNQEIKGTSVINIIGAKETGILRNEMVDVDPFTDVEGQIKTNTPTQNNEMLDDLPVTWESDTVIEDPTLLKLIYDLVPEALKDVTTKKYQPHHSEAWLRYYYEQATMDILADEYTRTKSVFSNKYDQGGWFAVFSKEVMGYACELALQRRFFQRFQVYGKNNPGEPDLYDPETGEMIEVKMRKRREPPRLDMLSSKELRAVKDGESVKLALVSYGPGKCTVEVWTPRLLSNPPPREK